MAQEPRRIQLDEEARRALRTRRMNRLNELGEMESIEIPMPEPIRLNPSITRWNPDEEDHPERQDWPVDFSELEQFVVAANSTEEEKKESIMETVARKTGLKKKPAKKIGLAWPAFLHSFRKFWPNIEVITDPTTANLYDLIVFSGGEDINPEFYGETNTMSNGVNNQRDHFEYAVFETAMNRTRSKTKFLGVCRGHQLLTALTGGSLWQDFSSSVNPDTGNKFRWHPSPHTLEFTRMYSAETSILYRFFKDQHVSSMHHQAVRNQSHSMRIICSYNGIVEGCEGDRMITTQFHPEFDYAPGNAADKFFKFIAEEW